MPLTEIKILLMTKHVNWYKINSENSKTGEWCKYCYESNFMLECVIKD